MGLINEILKSLLDLKERSLYDALSMGFVKLNLFPTLIKSIIAMPLEEQDYSRTARVFELCACH